ncbi:hypothetical protein PYW07_006479 [Mythimna separata]|uniref:Uncharacterized protein n=1 Tax=Mythimna separata TaxID=271217 RepID=A0AAD7YVE3_MYTSE|nr:hypothetical protein PYW07_006479 [Mythimna separata]
MDDSQVERWLHEVVTEDEEVIESEDDEVEPEPNLQALVRESELQENEEESSNLVGISRSEEPVPCSTLADSILHDSRTPSPSILNLPATPPLSSYDTEDVPKPAENPRKNSPDLAISEPVVPSTVFTSDVIPVASTSRDTSVTMTEIPFSPDTLRPLPKAPPRKGNQTNRRKVKSAILTDTPVKDELAAIEAVRMAKKKVKKPNFEETKKRSSKPNTKTKKTKVGKKQRRNEDSEEEEELTDFSGDDDDDEEYLPPDVLRALQEYEEAQNSGESEVEEISEEATPDDENIEEYLGLDFWELLAEQSYLYSNVYCIEMIHFAGVQLMMGFLKYAQGKLNWSFF